MAREKSPHQKLVDGALFWAKNGVPVFPCNHEKRPLTENGFKDAVTDPVKVKELFSFYGDAAVMIGARMGKDAGMFAIDVDLYKGGGLEKWVEDLAAQGLLPDTRMHKTKNGGVHILYKSDEFPNVYPRDGVEVRGEGSYIIMPPTPGYEVIQEGLAEAPKELIALLKSMRKAHAEETIDAIKAKIINGDNFHDSLARLAARYASMGWTMEKITASMMEILKASLCSNPAHPRHERWKYLVNNEGDEFLRTITTAQRKYSSAAASDGMTSAPGFDAAHMAKVASAVFTSAIPTSRESVQIKKAEEYAGQWPFDDDDGYFAHSDSIVDLNARYVLYPLFGEGESVLIAGEPKAGKTTVALAAGLHIATGIDLGKSLLVSEPRGVLYFGLEGRVAIRRRVEAWKRHMAGTGTELPEYIPFYVSEAGRNFLVEEIREQVAQDIKAATAFWQAKGIELGCVIVDTYTKAMMGGDQNSVEDTSAVFDIVTKLRGKEIDSKATVIFIHHKAKAGGVRGSSNIEADPDTIMSVMKEGDRIIWHLDRARTQEDGVSYHFTMKQLELGKNVQGHLITSVVADPIDSAVIAQETEISQAKTVNEIMSLLVGLGKGTHKLEKVHDMLSAAGLAPMNTTVKRGGARKIGWATKQAQAFYADLIPVTGYVFGGFSVQRVMVDGTIDSLHIF